MNLTGKPCPEFFVKVLPVVGFPDNTDDETTTLFDRKVSITDLLRANVPTVIDFYNSGWGGCRPVARQIKRWSSSHFSEDVLFVTVCVDSQKPEPVAREFQNLYFDNELIRKDIKEIKIINKNTKKLEIKQLNFINE